MFHICFVHVVYTVRSRHSLLLYCKDNAHVHSMFPVQYLEGRWCASANGSSLYVCLCTVMSWMQARVFIYACKSALCYEYCEWVLSSRATINTCTIAIVKQSWSSRHWGTIYLRDIWFTLLPSLSPRGTRIPWSSISGDTKTLIKWPILWSRQS